MKSALLVSLFTLSFTFAFPAFSATTIVLEGKTFDCVTSGMSFHCEKDNQKVLVIKSFMGYSAVSKTANNPPAMKWITKIEDNGKLIYETPRMPGIDGDFTITSFKAPESKSTMINNANAIITNYSKESDPWAVEFVSAAKSYVAKESTPKTNLKIQDYNGASYSCKSGETRPLTSEEESAEKMYNMKIQCNFYSCTGMNGKKVLAFIPTSGSYSGPHFLSIDGVKSVLRVDGFKVFDTDNLTQLPIYDTPVTPKFTGFHKSEEVVDQKLFVPKSFQANQSAFNYLTNPMVEQSMDSEVNSCTGNNEVTKLLGEKKNISESMKEELAKTELTHYLSMTDGQMLSLVIDAAKSRDLGCRYEDMILSAEAAKHLSFLQKAKAKPVQTYLSITEVQDLFNQARDMSDIPFGYKYDGCYARAHVMARRFEEKGIATEKVWIKGNLSVPGTDIQWNYHVAPVINVKDKDGVIKKYVIDPSLNDEAVTVDEWVATMSKNVKGGVMKTAYPFPVNIANFQRTAVAISSSDIFVPDNDELRTEEQNMAMALQTMKEYTEVLQEKADLQKGL